MIANLTAQDLAAHLEQRLRRMEEDAMPAAARAYCPMLTAFFGPTAAGDCQAIAARLGQYWPESCQDLKFLGMESAEAEYTELSLWGEAPAPLQGTPDRLISALFDTNTHFENYERLLAFYLLDSGDFQDESDLRLWLDALARLREEIRRDSRPLSDMLIFLLDESPEKEEAAQSIRRALGLISREDETFPAVLILSSRRSDNRIDKTRRTSMIAALMAVVNSADMPEDLFAPGLLTAGYGREEKPLDAVSQIVARTLLEWLSGGEAETEERLFADREALKARLGVSREGTFSFLDEYVSGTLMPYVPSRKQIEHFPIPAPDSANHARLSSSTISSKELNDFTFGAWDFCLTEAVRQAREQIERDLPDFRRWREEYAALLKARFTPGEQAILWDQINRVKGLLKFARLPSRDLPALVYAERWLHYLADSSPELLDVLAGEIQRLGKEAAEVVRRRGELLSSLDAMPPVEDEELSEFYQDVLDGFFVRRGEAIRLEFRRVRKEEDLPRFLEKTVKELLQDAQLKPIFLLDVEGELQARGVTSGGAFGGDGAPIYLRTEEELEEPIWTFLLYRADSALGAYFRAHLPEDTIFYDTGRGSILEALRIFRLEAEDLYPYAPGELPEKISALPPVVEMEPVVVEEAVAEQTLVEEAIPEQTVMQEAIPEQAVMQEAIPEQALVEEIPEKTPEMVLEALPVETLSIETEAVDEPPVEETVDDLPMEAVDEPPVEETVEDSPVQAEAEQSVQEAAEDFTVQETEDFSAQAEEEQSVQTEEERPTQALATLNQHALAKADNSYQMRLMRRVIPEPGDPHWMDTEEPLWLDADEFPES